MAETATIGATLTFERSFYLALLSNRALYIKEVKKNNNNRILVDYNVQDEAVDICLSMGIYTDLQM